MVRLWSYHAQTPGPTIQAGGRTTEVSHPAVSVNLGLNPRLDASSKRRRVPVGDNQGSETLQTQVTAGMHPYLLCALGQITALLCTCKTGF